MRIAEIAARWVFDLRPDVHKADEAPIQSDLQRMRRSGRDKDQRIRIREKMSCAIMAQEFWLAARRWRGAYPIGSATSDQRSPQPKEPARMLNLFFLESSVSS
jgi:hypothetical protein